MLQLLPQLSYSATQPRATAVPPQVPQAGPHSAAAVAAALLCAAPAESISVLLLPTKPAAPRAITGAELLLLRSLSVRVNCRPDATLQVKVLQRPGRRYQDQGP